VVGDVLDGDRGGASQPARRQHLKLTVGHQDPRDVGPGDELALAADALQAEPPRADATATKALSTASGPAMTAQKRPSAEPSASTATAPKTIVPKTPSASSVTRLCDR
jgi:hypothetical protein